MATYIVRVPGSGIMAVSGVALDPPDAAYTRVFIHGMGWVQAPIIAKHSDEDVRLSQEELAQYNR